MANSNPASNLDGKARSKGGRNSGGNFKHDRAKASEAGKKGGTASNSNSTDMDMSTEIVSEEYTI